MTHIDAEHLLVDLSTMHEIKGALTVDETGLVTVTKPDLNNELKTLTVQLPRGGWRVVRRR